MQCAFGRFDFWLGLFGHQGFGRRTHHLTNGFSFSQGFATALIQIFGTCGIGIRRSFSGSGRLCACSFGGLRVVIDSWRRGLGCCLCSLLGFGLLLGAVFGFLLFASATLFSQFLFLTTNQLGLTACFFFTARQFSFVNQRRCRRRGFNRP